VDSPPSRSSSAIRSAGSSCSGCSATTSPQRRSRSTPLPIKGVIYLPLSALRVASIALRNPANKKRAVALTAEQFRYGFGNAISATESAELYERWTIPSPGKPLFEAASANFAPHSPAKVNTGNATRGPLLLTAGGRDHTVPKAITKSTLKLYRKSSRDDGLQGVP